jgi:hypothetical protein
MAGWQKRRIQDVHGDSVLIRHVGKTLQFVYRGIQAAVRNLSAGHDILDAPAAERAEACLHVARLPPSAASASSATALRRRAAFGPAAPLAAAAAFSSTSAHYRAHLHESSLGRRSRTRGWMGRAYRPGDGARGDEVASIHGNFLRLSKSFGISPKMLSVIVLLFPTGCQLHIRSEFIVKLFYLKDALAWRGDVQEICLTSDRNLI